MSTLRVGWKWFFFFILFLFVLSACSELNELNKSSDTIEGDLPQVGVPYQKIVPVTKPILAKLADLGNNYGYYCSHEDVSSNRYQSCKINVVKFYGELENCKRDFVDAGFAELCMTEWAIYSGERSNCDLIPGNRQQGCRNHYDFGFIPKKSLEEMSILDFSIGDFSSFRYENINFSSRIEDLSLNTYRSWPNIWVDVTVTERGDLDEVPQTLLLYTSKGIVNRVHYEYIAAHPGQTSALHAFWERDIPDEDFGKVVYLVSVIYPKNEEWTPYETVEEYEGKEWAFVYPLRLPDQKRPGPRSV